MDITPQMTSRWVKAVFLILLGIVLLLYADGLVDDMERASADEFNLSFEWTWDLLRILIWIVIAWLFVDAVLIIVLSFKMSVHTTDDVMAKLKSIEKRMMAAQKAPPAVAPEVDQDMYPAVEVMEQSDEEPPPPVE
ncbi:MAG TPA: hypothetical protein VMW71_07960 [Thermoplasmata archaeon]|nr:hypothetical protein [Thermoplasmata archaeon]